MSDLSARDQAVLPMLGSPGAYISKDDYLRVSVFGAGGANTCTVTGRYFDLAEGRVKRFSFSIVISGGYTSASESAQQVGEGWILSLTVGLSTTDIGVATGYVQVQITSEKTGAGNVLATLIQTYVSSKQRAAWPGSAIRSTLELPGSIRSITGTDPAANTEISETVLTGARWRLRSFRFTLVSDANAANREVELVIDDGTTEITRISSGANQAASLTRIYVFALGVPHKVSAAGGTIMAPLPDLALGSGYRVRTVTTNLQVTDNYGAPQYQPEQWIELT